MVNPGPSTELRIGPTAFTRGLQDRHAGRSAMYRPGAAGARGYRR
jgi:hypothetical protein